MLDQAVFLTNGVTNAIQSLLYKGLHPEPSTLQRMSSKKLGPCHPICLKGLGYLRNAHGRPLRVYVRGCIERNVPMIHQESEQEVHVLSVRKRCVVSSTFTVLSSIHRSCVRDQTETNPCYWTENFVISRCSRADTCELAIGPDDRKPAGHEYR